jgi:hypothetical protein
VSSGGEDLDQRRGKRGREQVLQVLSHVGIRDARAEELLSGIEFPATLSEVYAQFGKDGIAQDSFIDQMGGSP